MAVIYCLCVSAEVQQKLPLGFLFVGFWLQFSEARQTLRNPETTEMDHLEFFFKPNLIPIVVNNSNQ